MKLPVPDDVNTRTAYRILEQEDARNFKRGQNVEVGVAELVLTSPDGTRYAVRVNNAGTLVTFVL
jgi:hypothetical protein